MPTSEPTHSPAGGSPGEGADTARAIDALVLACSGEEACKVAMLIARVTDAAAAGGLTVTPQNIAARIYALADAGALAVSGNVRRWRAAEVKRGRTQRPA